MDKYILDGRTPVKTDLMTWAKSFEGGARQVADTRINGVRISTVFLGLDHSFGEGPPLLFETMIFGGPHDEFMDRCTTWAQAEQQHERACALAKSGLPERTA